MLTSTSSEPTLDLPVLFESSKHEQIHIISHIQIITEIIIQYLVKFSFLDSVASSICSQVSVEMLKTKAARQLHSWAMHVALGRQSELLEQERVALWIKIGVVRVILRGCEMVELSKMWPCVSVLVYLSLMFPLIIAIGNFNLIAFAMATNPLFTLFSHNNF